MSKVKLFCLIGITLCILIILGSIGFTAFATEDPEFCKFVEYSITDKPPFITRNTTFNIKVKLEATQEIGERLTADNFSIGDDYSFSKKIPNAPEKVYYEDGFVYVTFEKVKYTGNGNTFDIKAVHPDDKNKYINILFPIEGVEEYRPGAINLEVGAPDIIISRNTFDKPIKAGEKFTVRITVRNNSSRPTMVSPVAYVTPSEAFIIKDVSDSYRLANIQGGKNVSFNVNLEALETISSPSQSLTIDVRYSYYSGEVDVATSATQKLFIPCEQTENKENAPPPSLRITRSEIASPVKSGDELTVKVTIENTSDDKIESPIAFITPTDAFMLLDSVGSKYLPSIEPHSSTSFDVNLKALDKITSPAHGFTVDLKYTYTRLGVISQESSSEKIWIPVVENQDTPEDAPIIEITRNDIESPIKEGEEVTVTLNIKNLGSISVDKPVILFNAPDSFMLVDTTSSKVLESIPAGQSLSVDVTLRALDKISSPAQSLNVDLSYSYVTNGNRSNGSASEKIWIPVVETTRSVENSASPLVKIDREAMQSVREGSTFNVKVTITNLSDVNLDNLIAQLSCSDAIVLNETTGSKIIGSLGANASSSFEVALKATDEIRSASQTLSVDLSYSYLKGGSRENGSATERIQIPVVVTDDADYGDVSAATPNLIISKYDFGGDHVVTGSNFDLSLEFKNTSKSIKVENIVMTIEPEQGISIASASNTYYYESLGALGSLGEKLTLQALPTASNGSVTINVGFRYEYVSGKQRSSQSTNQSISIPLIHPDRFEVSVAQLPEMVNVGDEVYVSFNYINKGKADISNVHAEVIGEVPALEREQNLGNFEPGKSGSIDFILMPNMAGEIDATVAITYEDPNLKEKTLEFPLKLIVNEVFFENNFNYIPDEPIEDDTQNGIAWWIWAIIAFAIVVVLIIIVIALKKKRSKMQDTETDFKWDDDDEMPISNTSKGEKNR